MSRNHHLAIIFRHLLKYKGYTATNIMGLAVGMACCVLILLYVQDELSYDHHHEKKDGIRIFRFVDFRRFCIPLIQGDGKTALADPNTVVISESMGTSISGKEIRSAK